MHDIRWKGDSLKGILKEAKYVIYDPAGTGLTSTTVQGAISEINSNISTKVSKSGDTMTGNLTIDNGYITVNRADPYLVLNNPSTNYQFGLHIPDTHFAIYNAVTNRHELVIDGVTGLTSVTALDSNQGISTSGNISASGNITAIGNITSSGEIFPGAVSWQTGIGGLGEQIGGLVVPHHGAAPASASYSLTVNPVTRYRFFQPLIVCNGTYLASQFVPASVFTLGVPIRVQHVSDGAFDSGGAKYIARAEFSWSNGAVTITAQDGPPSSSPNVFYAYMNCYY